MANCKLLWKNLANNAAVTGGHWQTALPLINVQNTLISMVARTTNTNLASTQLLVDLGDTAPIYDTLALVNHNLSASALVRVTTSAVADYSVLAYDSGWVAVYPPAFSPAVVAWESDRWYFGPAADADMDKYQRTWVFFTNPIQTARYVKVEFNDTTNTDAYIQAGRLLLGQAWQWASNFDYGHSFRWVDDSVISKSLAGVVYAERRKKRRKFTFNGAFFTDNEAYQNLFEMQRLLGVYGEVLVVPDADDTVNGFRRNFLGRMVTLDPIEHYQLNLNKIALDFEELI